MGEIIENEPLIICNYHFFFHLKQVIYHKHAFILSVYLFLTAIVTIEIF